MKSVSILLAIGLIASAQAQQACLAEVAKVPTCANSCILSAASAVGCGADDFKCQCGSDKSAAIAETALPCVVSACGAITGLAVQSSAAAVCACAATAAPGAATTSVKAASTPASAPASSAQVSSAPVTSTPKAASTPAITSSPSRPATSAPPFPTTTTSHASSASGTAASGSGHASPSGSGAGSVPFLGAATRVMGSVAGIMGALFAAFIAL